MAFTPVQSVQSGGGANASSITITAATAGNLLCSFFAQSGSVVQPTCSGFTVVGTSAVYSLGADSVWFATKIATGGETSIAWTAGSGGTGRGVCGWEHSGAPASVVFDVTAVHTDNLAAATSATSPLIATSTPGSIVFIGVGSNASSGTLSAWSGTNVATNINTAGSRCFGGSFITTTTISSTFTGNWTNSHVAALLAVAIAPAGGSTKAITGASTMSLSVGGDVRDVSLSGAATIATSVTGDAHKTAKVAGAVGLSTSVTGDAHKTAAVSGAVGFSTSVAGNINRTKVAVSGSVSMSTSVAGAIYKDSGVAGAVSLSTSVSGALAVIWAITGTVAVTTTATGALSRTAAVAGAVLLTTSVSGTVTASGSSSLGGAVTVSTSVAGGFARTAAVAGSVLIRTTVTGDIFNNAAASSTGSGDSQIFEILTATHHFF